MTGAKFASWDNIIDKNVISVDDQELGKVEFITRDFIQANQGLISKKYYFIPKHYVSGFDGKNIWISLTKDEVKSRFRRGEEEPNTGVLDKSYLFGKQLIVFHMEREELKF